MCIRDRLTEPDVAVAPEGDGPRKGVRSGNRVLANDASRGNPTHPIAGVLGEPEVAVGADGDDPRRTAGVRKGELGEARPVGPHPADTISGAFGKPERAVLSKGDRGRAAAGVGQRKLGDDAVGGQNLLARREPALLTRHSRSEGEY